VEDVSGGKTDALFSARDMVSNGKCGICVVTRQSLANQSAGLLLEVRNFEPCSLNFISDSIVATPKAREYKSSPPTSRALYRVSASTTFPPHNIRILFSITRSSQESLRLLNLQSQSYLSKPISEMPPKKIEAGASKPKATGTTHSYQVSLLPLRKAILSAM